VRRRQSRGGAKPQRALRDAGPRRGEPLAQSSFRPARALGPAFTPSRWASGPLRTAAASAPFWASRRTAPRGATGSGATDSGPATLSPHLLGKLHQFIPVELAVLVGVERHGTLHEPLRVRRTHPRAPSPAGPTLRRSSRWRSSRATLPLARATRAALPSTWATRPTLTRRAASGRALASSLASGGPKPSRRALARRPMVSGGMRRAKLLLVDDAVSVAVEAEESSRGVFDFFRIEPVIVIAIEGLAERVKRRRAGRASV